MGAGTHRLTVLRAFAGSVTEPGCVRISLRSILIAHWGIRVPCALLFVLAQSFRSRFKSIRWTRLDVDLQPLANLVLIL